MDFFSKDFPPRVLVREGIATIPKTTVHLYRAAPDEQGQGVPNVWKLWDRAKLDELLDGMTRTEFMLRFAITHPDLHTTIVGTLNPAHLAENIASIHKGPLPSSVYNEAKKRLAAAGVVPLSSDLNCETIE